MPGSTKNFSTPHIDALFQSGITFTDAYAGEAVCAPSRSTLLTGRHTGHAHIRGNYATNGHDLPLLANETTFFETLQDAGYFVACVGKWGLGWFDSTGSPHLKGCTTYYGVLDQSAAHDMYPSNNNVFEWDAAQGWRAVNITQPPVVSRDGCMAANTSCVWVHDLFTTRALAVIAERAAQPDVPFLLYLAWTDPHAGGWAGDQEQGNPVPSDGEFASKTQWPPNERDHASVIQNYQDRDVGLLVAALATHGLTKSTITIFASDNGASNEGLQDYTFFGSSGPLTGFKRCLTDGGIRTPSGVSWPGTIPSGIVSNFSHAFWDWPATLLELAGVPPSSWPPNMDGQSLVPLLTNPTSPSGLTEVPLYWEVRVDSGGCR